MSRTITGKTKILGIIGDPVEHSISPVFQNYLLEQYNLNYIYIPFHLKKEQSSVSIKTIFQYGVTGANITIPFKEIAYKTADIKDKLSELTGAVNTLNYKNNILYGYNSDGPGFWESITQYNNIKLTNIALTVLGNGGAAKGIIGEGILRGIKDISIVARNRDKSIEFIKRTGNYPTNIKHINWENITSLSPYKNKTNIIVNTTSIGMNGERLPFNWKIWDKSTIFSDIVYNQGKTKWLLDAEKNGFLTHEGYLMLVGQGIISFEIWTGIKPEFNKIAEFVREWLYGSSDNG